MKYYLDIKIPEGLNMYKHYVIMNPDLENYGLAYLRIFRNLAALPIYPFYLYMYCGHHDYDVLIKNRGRFVKIVGKHLYFHNNFLKVL